MTSDDEAEILAALSQGTLEVLSSTALGQPAWCSISSVVRHYTPHKRAYRVTTEGGRSVTATEDHSLFTVQNGLPVEVLTSTLCVGSALAVLQEGVLISDPVASIEEVNPLNESYDLCVPGPENFTTSSGILAHNTYSIGGVSLDLEKSSKYQSAADAYKDTFNTQIEQVKRTVKFTMGLRQPKFGMGIRSSFGPYTGDGVVTPAKYMGF